MLALPIVKPAKTHSVGLVVRDQDPASPLVRALEAVALKAGIARQLARAGGA